MVLGSVIRWFHYWTFIFNDLWNQKVMSNFNKGMIFIGVSLHMRKWKIKKIVKDKKLHLISHQYQKSLEAEANQFHCTRGKEELVWSLLFHHYHFTTYLQLLFKDSGIEIWDMPWRVTWWVLMVQHIPNHVVGLQYLTTVMRFHFAISSVIVVRWE